MKYIVVLGDGMADRPVDALGGKTPLEAAVTPVMDVLASKGTLGTVQNVPAGMAPGSDVANLSVLGYDPAANYSGRSPLEALSVGVAMDDDDVIFRSNLVTLTENQPYDQKIILDHSSGEISTADADVLLQQAAVHGSRLGQLGGVFQHLRGENVPEGGLPALRLDSGKDFFAARRTQLNGILLHLWIFPLFPEMRGNPALS